MIAQGRSMAEIAAEFWGPDVPDWIEVLAKACDATSQSKTGHAIGRSGPVVSEVLRQKYKGDMAGIEELVRGKLMRAVVQCPALGILPTHECQSWRKASDHFLGTNSLRVRMYRACNRCAIKAAVKKEAQK